MSRHIEEQVVDYFAGIFERVFSESFRPAIPDPLKRRAVLRQVEESADAASQSLTRLFLNQRLTSRRVGEILEVCRAAFSALKLEEISNPNANPEALVAGLAGVLPRRDGDGVSTDAAVVGLALHSTAQVLMLVGPVMVEWQKLGFATTFELPRRVVNRLNQISQQMGAIGRAGEAAADDRYELTYRDYLLQRFHRIEAGTVRMTTNLDIDLRELFVMPRVLERPSTERSGAAGAEAAAAYMALAEARKLFGDAGSPQKQDGKEKAGVPAIEQVTHSSRNVIVGAPGSGKSTFFEWLQLKLASAEEMFVMAGQQAIPLLLRVRQLDTQKLPRGAALIEQATGSKDQASLMPAGWIERQMAAGRVLFMVDGLDETDPESRDRHLIPWLLKLVQKYPACRWLVSSRPVGYPPAYLREHKFAECELLDFGESEIAEYTKHWCTAVRLARNEAIEEARREGTADGKAIVESFQKHGYIRNLARNPLMLSAICLVNYFEQGELPKDRAVLYRLCVEGLLHHWDQRRGIHSEFGLAEKLRACREVAVAMQADDRAEYEGEKVLQVFTRVFDDSDRARKLLEHVRYRTGLLLERRAGGFAFAHLTFQEYLAAQAVLEGNLGGIDSERLVREHDDGRWQEVIALYAAMASLPAAGDLLDRLMAQPDTDSLGAVLAEAYLSGRPELAKDRNLRNKVLARIAVCPGHWPPTLNRFPPDEVALVANEWLGRTQGSIGTGSAYRWLFENPWALDVNGLVTRLREHSRYSPAGVGEMVHLLHRDGPDDVLVEEWDKRGVYTAVGPIFSDREGYHSQAEIAIVGLADRSFGAARARGPAFSIALLRALRAVCSSPSVGISLPHPLSRLTETLAKGPLPHDSSTWPEFASLARKLAQRLSQDKHPGGYGTGTSLNGWADRLSQATTEQSRAKAAVARKPSPKRTKTRKRSSTK
ncbi:MAG: NACHT domain-containing protein [Bryobacterales bacterium]|nr:NACHT domain-containing protein [Bryobacterales bacterium]